MSRIVSKEEFDKFIDSHPNRAKLIEQTVHFCTPSMTCYYDTSINGTRPESIVGQVFLYEGLPKDFGGPYDNEYIIVEE